MKVLQVNVDGWFYGRPKYVYNLSKLLLQKRITCKVVGGSGSFEDELIKSNIENIRIFPKWKQLDRSLRSIINLYKAIRAEKPDLIHCHGISENIIVGLIGSILKIPVIVTYHTNPFNKYKRESSGRRKFKRFLYELIYFCILTKLASRYFSYITVISKELQNDFVKRGYKKDKVIVTYFGVDIPKRDNKFSVKAFQETTIAFIGRLSKDKGCVSLLRACKILANRGTLFKLYLIGNGDMEYFSKMARKLGIRDRVVFTGFRLEFGEILLDSDMFVLPSRGEGLPISVLEAMAYGLPVVATNVGGISEVIEDGKNGLLVPPDDEISLANAIAKIIEGGAKERYIIGLRNKKKIEANFSSKKMIDRYLHVYKKAISHCAYIE